MTSAQKRLLGQVVGYVRPCEAQKLREPNVRGFSGAALASGTPFSAKLPDAFGARRSFGTCSSSAQRRTTSPLLPEVREAYEVRAAQTKVCLPGYAVFAQWEQSDEAKGKLRDRQGHRSRTCVLADGSLGKGVTDQMIPAINRLCEKTALER